MSYDSGCLDLAEAFLSDDDSLTPERCDALAQRIQEAIEDWLALHPMPAKDDET
jgi:hypothetical protein